MNFLLKIPRGKLIFPSLPSFVPLPWNLKIQQPLNMFCLYTEKERDYLYNIYKNIYYNIKTDDIDKQIYNFLYETYYDNQFDIFDSVMVIILTSYIYNFENEILTNSFHFSEHYNTLKQYIINYRINELSDIIIEYKDICYVNKMIVMYDEIVLPTTITIFNKYFNKISTKYIELISLMIHYRYNSDKLINIVLNINPPLNVIYRNKTGLYRTYSSTSISELDEDGIPNTPNIREHAYNRSIKINTLIDFILYGIMYLSKYTNINGLHVYNLRMNQINKDTIDIFLNYLERLNIDKITLSNNETYNNNIDIIMSILRNPNIKKLKLDNLLLTDLQNISELLEINTSLLKLSLNHIKFKYDINETLNNIYDAISKNITIKTLKLKDLRYNQIICSPNLINMLNTNNSLIKIDFSHNDLRLLFTQEFINALKYNTNIAYVNIHKSYLFGNFQNLLCNLMTVNLSIIDLSVGKPVYVMKDNDDYLIKSNVQIIK